MSSSRGGRRSISPRRSSSRNFFWSCAEAETAKASERKSAASSSVQTRVRFPLIVCRAPLWRAAREGQAVSVVVLLGHPQEDPDRPVIRDGGAGPRVVAREH